MCRSCGKLMGLETICPWCGAKHSERFQRTVARSQGGQGTAVTGFLTGAIVIIYIAAIAFGGIREGGGLMGLLGPNPEFLNDAGLMNTQAVLSGQWWRLIGAVFLHLSLMHIAFNAMALWSIGRPLEDDVGGAALWTFFIVAGIAGFALGLPFDSPNSAGASGSISGLIGAVIARRRIADGNFDAPITRLSIRFAVFTAVFGLAVPGINNIAHGGGFVAGALLGALFSWAEGLPWARLFWRISAVIGAGVAIAAAASLALAGPQIGGDDVVKMDRCLRSVAMTLTRMEPGSPNTLTTRLDPCLTKKTIFESEPDALAAIVEVEAAVNAAHAALAGGLPREINAAASDFELSMRRWQAWVTANLKRFGLTMGGGEGP